MRVLTNAEIESDVVAGGGIPDIKKVVDIIGVVLTVDALVTYGEQGVAWVKGQWNANSGGADGWTGPDGESLPT